MSAAIIPIRSIEPSDSFLIEIPSGVQARGIRVRCFAPDKVRFAFPARGETPYRLPDGSVLFISLETGLAAPSLRA